MSETYILSKGEFIWYWVLFTLFWIFGLLLFAYVCKFGHPWAAFCRIRKSVDDLEAQKQKSQEVVNRAVSGPAPIASRAPPSSTPSKAPRAPPAASKPKSNPTCKSSSSTPASIFAPTRSAPPPRTKLVLPAPAPLALPIPNPWTSSSSQAQMAASAEAVTSPKSKANQAKVEDVPEDTSLAFDPMSYTFGSGKNMAAMYK